MLPTGEGREVSSGLQANSLSTGIGLQKNRQPWTDSERDLYPVSHPFHRPLTVRGMLYFNALSFHYPGIVISYDNSGFKRNRAYYMPSSIWKAV